MMNPTRPPVNHRFAATRTGEVEELLRRFYRAEMPESWPAAPAVAAPTSGTPRRLAVGRFFRAPRRLALAASVALLVIGFLALQTWFPEPQPASEVGSPLLMQKMDMQRRVPNRTPASAPQGAGAKPRDQQPMLLPYQNLPAKK
jgi:hypothetical protein